MQITSSQSRQDVLSWAIRVKDLLVGRGDTEAISGVDKAIAAFIEDRFLIAVLGKAKRGKSTLLNAILGRHDDLVAPVDKLPTSNAITRFLWADRDAATVFFRDGKSSSIGFDRIRDYVTEESNPQNRKAVDVVEVAGPFPGLDRDLVLVDTPGAASVHEHHDAILHAFIPQADAVIFLVTARMPLDQDELDLLKQVKAADIRKVFFAVNRIDESNSVDIDAAVSHNCNLLSEIGIHVDRIHRISARKAFLGIAADSGLPDLLSDVGDFLAANKGRVLSARLISRVCQYAEPTAQALAVELGSSQKTVGELDEDLKKLSDSIRTIETERALTERELTLQWDRAVNAFEHSAKEAAAEILVTIDSRIASTSLVGLGALVKELPTIISRTIEDQLAASAQKLEESVSAAARKLQASYPAIEVASAGAVTVRTRAGHHVVVGGLS